MLATATSAVVAAAIGASLRFMLDPAVDRGACSLWKLDRAMWLSAVTGTMTVVATLLAGVWLLQRSIRGGQQLLLRVAVAVAALALLACTWWMFSILGSSE